MWSANNGPYHGKHNQLEETLCSPQPLSRPHPPILVAGGGEKKTLRLGAQYADACNLFGPPETVRAKLAILRQHCDALGRDYDSIEKTTLGTVDLRPGKMGANDYFDVNGPGSDSHLQFMNWTVDNNGAYDYAADTRGYTTGGIAEYDDRNWSLRYGIFAMPVIANGIDLDWAFSRAHGQNGEFELRHSWVPQRKGTTRILFYGNTAHMGTYREAVEAFLNGSDYAKYAVTVPTITLHEHFGALKYGVGYNTEQEVTENLRVFGRFGWNEGQHESFAYTEVDQTVLAGADYIGTRWHRPADKIGLAVVSNAIKADHQEYLKLGGLGFLLGDGKLNYGRENIVEGYYNYHAWRGMFYALDVQHIVDPGYNRDRGPVWVGSLRAHIDF